MTIQKASPWISAAGCLALILMLIVFYANGWFTDASALQNVLKSCGIFAPLLFILLQIIQVVVPVIPGGVSNVIGVVAFGPVRGFVYNYIGICTGSLLAFLLIRWYGKPLFSRLVPQDKCEKYLGYLNKGKKFQTIFAAAIFLPCAPDDLLCMVAGLSSMTCKTFLLIILLGKPLSLMAYSWSLLQVFQFFA